MANHDEISVDDYLRGDPAAFDALDQLVRGLLRGRYPGLHSEHDDVAQAVHVKLIESLRVGRFTGEKRLEAYVWGIVHHTAIDRLRAIYRQRVLFSGEDPELVASSDDSYKIAEDADEERAMHQAILAVPASCRELWRLVLVDKLSYEEIGERLSIPAGTVKSRMWYCRRKAMSALRRIRRESTTPPR